MDVWSDEEEDMYPEAWDDRDMREEGGRCGFGWCCCGSSWEERAAEWRGTPLVEQTSSCFFFRDRAECR